MASSLIRKLAQRFPTLLGNQAPWHIWLNFAFGLIALIIVASAALSGFHLQRYGQMVESTTAQSFSALEAAEELSAYSVLLSAGLPSMEHTQRLEELAPLTNRLSLHRQKVRERLQQLQDWLPADQLSQVQEQLGQMGDAFSQLISLHVTRFRLASQKQEQRHRMRNLRAALLDIIPPLDFASDALTQSISHSLLEQFQQERLAPLLQTVQLDAELAQFTLDLAQQCFPQSPSQSPAKPFNNPMPRLQSYSMQLPTLTPLLHKLAELGPNAFQAPCQKDVTLTLLKLLQQTHQANTQEIKQLNLVITQQLPSSIGQLLKESTDHYALTISIKTTNNRLHYILTAALLTQNLEELRPLLRSARQTYAFLAAQVSQYKNSPMSTQSPLLVDKIESLVQQFSTLLEGDEGLLQNHHRHLLNKQAIALNIKNNLHISSLLSARVTQLVKDVKQQVNNRRQTMAAGLPSQIWLLALTTLGGLLIVTLIALLTSHLLKQRQQQLTEGAKRLRIVVENMPIMLQAFDNNHNIVVWNSECERITGYSRAEVIGQQHIMQQLYPLEMTRQKVLDLFTKQKSNFRNVEFDLTSKTGTQHTIAWSSSHHHFPIPGWGAWAVGVDVTQRTTLERELLLHRDNLDTLVQSRTQALQQAMLDLGIKTAEVERFNRELAHRVEEEVENNRAKDGLLIHQSRMAAMGEMIGNIAHQWRQPLSAVNLILFNIKDMYLFGELDESTLQAKTEQASALLQSMSQTIDDFRNFFKPDKVLEHFDFNLAVEHALSLVASAMENHQITLHFEPYPEPLIIEGYPRELSQVILLLLNNAKDAIVETEHQKGLISLKLTEVGTQTKLTIQDSGNGIPKDILDRIFEPYFTTKEESKGTGIGLYMARMIIMEHMHGTIMAHNEPQGACFTLNIPRAEGHTLSAEQEQLT
ncbi:PAS domain-containing sensor histidine kinase [Magnetococcus marinus]|nr:PAS domain-containing sensor histidine kinase [Magnetococcus marinus]